MIYWERNWLILYQNKRGGGSSGRDHIVLSIMNLRDLVRPWTVHGYKEAGYISFWIYQKGRSGRIYSRAYTEALYIVYWTFSSLIGPYIIVSD